MQPKLSVILPVLNGEKYLEESINSILSQSFEDLELLIINDGSSDNTKDIILKKSREDKRIVYFENRRNQGLVKALNKGLYFSRGELIARMDADDISMPRRFERQVQCFSENPALDILGTDIIPLKENETEEERKPMAIPAEIHRLYLTGSNTLVHPTVMIRKARLLEHRLFYDRWAYFVEDYKLWADASINNLRIETLGENLLKYRVHKNQVSQQYRKKQQVNAIEIILRLGMHYFHEVITGREFLYVNLIGHKQYDVSDEKVNKLIADLIKYNHKNRVFDHEHFLNFYHYITGIKQDTH